MINEYKTIPGKKLARLSIESHDQAKNGVVACLLTAPPLTPRGNNLVFEFREIRNIYGRGGTA